MVDMQAINAKLVGRSENILRRLSGRNSEDVREALRAANGNVKTAMLILHGCTTEKATALLEEAGGRLRMALRLVEGYSAEAELPSIEADLPSTADSAGENSRS
jgi:N-acetylmuramic acid 6-phosphate etherase